MWHAARDAICSAVGMNVVERITPPDDVPIARSLVSGSRSLELFAALEQLHGARVFLGVCNAQGAALVRIQLAPAAQRLRLRTLVPVYQMAMGHMQRSSALGCGGRGKLALLMSQGGEGAVAGDYRTLMDCIVRRVAAGCVAATPEGWHAKAEALCAVGECAAAASHLQQAISRGHLPSRAGLAHMLITGSEGVARDQDKAFELAEEGARLGCHHCKGVTARCYLVGLGCSKDAARALVLAHESAAKGSKYGQCMLGWVYRDEHCLAKLAERDHDAAITQWRLATAQNFDAAQNELGFMYQQGYGVEKDYAEALRWFKLAAAQGFGVALCNVGWCYEKGLGVAVDKAEAIRWYTRAAAAGYSGAEGRLTALGA
jgi:TPR repeat protein